MACLYVCTVIGVLSSKMRCYRRKAEQRGRGYVRGEDEVAERQYNRLLCSMINERLQMSTIWISAVQSTWSIKFWNRCMATSYTLFACETNLSILYVVWMGMCMLGVVSCLSGNSIQLEQEFVSCPEYRGCPYFGGWKYTIDTVSVVWRFRSVRFYCSTVLWFTLGLGLSGLSLRWCFEFELEWRWLRVVLSLLAYHFLFACGWCIPELEGDKYVVSE